MEMKNSLRLRWIWKIFNIEKYKQLGIKYCFDTIVLHIKNNKPNNLVKIIHFFKKEHELIEVLKTFER